MYTWGWVSYEPKYWGSNNFKDFFFFLRIRGFFFYFKLAGVSGGGGRREGEKRSHTFSVSMDANTALRMEVA